MLRVFEVRLPFDHNPNSLIKAAAKALRVEIRDIETYSIRRRAIDARKKNEIQFVYTLDVVLSNNARPKAEKVHKVQQVPEESYCAAQPGKTKIDKPIVIAGSGPAGLFTGLLLAQQGYRPIIIERGKSVDERCRDVERFWKEGVLLPESNAQFGEGGAGTFSDGKLNTTIHDPRIRKVLEELVAAGAEEDILYIAKPHIGTDRLRQVVRTIREKILSLGGAFRFENQLSGLSIDNQQLKSITINNSESIECAALVVAIGHSARDTFAMLDKMNVPMLRKPFAVGVRIEHPQKLIDETQFGKFAGNSLLGAADYKMAWHGPNGRSAFSFCMCPGGTVIGASSEAESVVCNGMSYYARNGQNSNAALLVNVVPDDFTGESPLAGFTFQRMIENRAFICGGKNYYAPVQLLRDFKAGKPTESIGFVKPTYGPGVTPSDLSKCLPDFVYSTLQKAIPAFAHQLHGYDLGDAILTGVESRSSCPVRITRGEDYQSAIKGIYPAGEGAGYAGGIMSAAVDGIKVAEAIISRFAVP